MNTIHVPKVLAFILVVSWGVTNTSSFQSRYPSNRIINPVAFVGQSSHRATLSLLTLSSSSSTTAGTESTVETKETMMETTTSMSALEKEALQYFFTEEQINGIRMEHADGGVSNRMSFITVPMTASSVDGINHNNAIRYLLRIYNNGGNSRVVAFEHEILRQLSNQLLSFAIPTALPLRTDETKTHILLSSGDEACIFDVIPGVLPKLEAVFEIGKASGELHTTMGKLDVPRSMSDQPQYYDIFHVHHAIQSKETFYNHIASSSFDIGNARDDVNQLVQYVRDMEVTIDTLLQKDFPIQLIHGDLHYDNVLIDTITKQVTGLLDFEYCGFDWRPVELAVCLSKYSSEAQPFDYFIPFVQGYCQTAYLSPEEIIAIPDLMILRILSNVVFFVGRTLTGEDEPQQLTKRAAMYNSRIEWINEHRQELINLISDEMIKNHPSP